MLSELFDTIMQRRSPHGERGLKYQRTAIAGEIRATLSSWRAWIEMIDSCWQCCSHCRSPHGERGLKYKVLGGELVGFGRSPHGERGLKFTAPYAFIECSFALLMESVD